jgi:hypothetical protein
MPTTTTTTTKARERALENEFKHGIAHLPAKERLARLKEYREKRAEEMAGNSATTPQQAPEPQPEPEKPRKRVLPHGPLQWVTVEEADNLPGFEGARVGFDLGARWSVMQGKERDDDGLGVLRRLMVLAPAFENLPEDPLTDEKIPSPVYGDLDSYIPLMARAAALTRWAVRPGLARAIEESIKN